MAIGRTARPTPSRMARQTMNRHYLGDFYDDMVVGPKKCAALARSTSSPVLVDGVLFFGSTDGNVYALE